MERALAPKIGFGELTQSGLLGQDQTGPWFAPHDFDSEAMALAQAAREFMTGEVVPALKPEQSHRPETTRELLLKAGELGLLGLDIPEAFGGLGLTRSCSALLAEAVSIEPSFAVSHNVHTSVATLPIWLFGTKQQQSEWLPQLASGEIIGAYALSESHAGSDAMASRTRATRVKGGWSLTGEKMWITNAGFAGLFTVFAKTGESSLSAFLVPDGAKGLTLGAEERKSGLHASSTRRISLDGVVVDENSLLGEVGMGGKIALYTLNLGRFKIAASSIGQAKHALNLAAQYALERKAFGKPIAYHGLVLMKLARMAASVFAAESALYRTAGLLDRAFQGEDMSDNAQAGRQSAAALFSPECALVKAVCTEALDLCVDECVQIHGGYGFSEEFPAARAWRDARVTRIYEGTNEINRLNLCQLLAKRAAGDRTPFDQPRGAHPLRRAATNLFKASVPHLADERFGQHVAFRLAGTLMAQFQTESAFARAGACQKMLQPHQALAADYAVVMITADAAEEIGRNQMQVAGLLGDWAPPEKVEVLCARTRRQVIEAEEALGQAVIQAGGWVW